MKVVALGESDTCVEEAIVRVDGGLFRVSCCVRDSPNLHLYSASGAQSSVMSVVSQSSVMPVVSQSSVMPVVSQSSVMPVVSPSCGSLTFWWMGSRTRWEGNASVGPGVLWFVVDTLFSRRVAVAVEAPTVNRRRMCRFGALCTRKDECHFQHPGQQEEQQQQQQEDASLSVGCSWVECSPLEEDGAEVFDVFGGRTVPVGRFAWENVKVKHFESAAQLLDGINAACVEVKDDNATILTFHLGESSFVRCILKQTPKSLHSLLKHRVLVPDSAKQIALVTLSHAAAAREALTAFGCNSFDQDRSSNVAVVAQLRLQCTELLERNESLEQAIGKARRAEEGIKAELSASLQRETLMEQSFNAAAQEKWNRVEEDLKVRLAAREAELSASLQRKTSMEQSFNAAQEKWNRVEEDLKARLSAREAELKTALQGSASVEQTLKEAREEARRTEQGLNARLAECQGSLNSARGAAEQSVANARRVEHELSSQVSALQAKLSAAESLSTTREEELLKLRATVDEHTKKLQLASKALTEASKMIEQRNATIEEKNAHLQQFGELMESTKKLIEARGSKLEELKAEAKAKTVALDQSRQQCEELKAETAQLHKLVQDLMEANERMEKHLVVQQRLIDEQASRMVALTSSSDTFY